MVPVCRKWRLISHPDTVNPFLASFVNYQCTLQLQAITVGNQTFFNWEGEEGACSAPQAALTAWHAAQPCRPPRSMLTGGSQRGVLQGSSSPRGSMQKA